jgi:hypothetical protein
MRRHKYWSLYGLALAVGLAIPAAARSGELHHANGGTTVPPGDEIQVLDPGVDPTGKPAVLVKTTTDKTQLTVEIPPSVLVFRYYYTGDRSFQAQILPGGPTRVVLHHPRTGEQCILDVQMPPGAPRVTYSGRGVEFDYGPRKLSIVFPPYCRPKVVYGDSHTSEAAAALSYYPHQWMHACGIDKGAETATEGGKAACSGLAAGVAGLGKAALMPVKNAASFTPVGSLFEQDPAAAAKRARDQAVQKAEAEKTRLEADYRTLR